MNYNKRNPTFSFRCEFNDRLKLDKLAKIDKISTNELARKIITMYVKNELVKKTDDKQERLMELRIKKLEQEIKYMEIKTNYFEAFNQPMSRSATVHIKPEIIVETNKPTQEFAQSPYDAKNIRLQCIDCGSLFLWKSPSGFNSQIVEYQRHIKAKHNRELTTIEHDVILRLNFEGEST